MAIVTEFSIEQLSEIIISFIAAFCSQTTDPIAADKNCSLLYVGMHTVINFRRILVAFECIYFADSLFAVFSFPGRGL